jgi:hypothetical protein
VPGDTAAKVHQTKEPEQKNDFDEWLARIICFAFSVPPQWAVKVMNRATADNQSAQSEEEGLEPTKEWVKDLIDDIKSAVCWTLRGRNEFRRLYRKYRNRECSMDDMTIFVPITKIDAARRLVYGVVTAETPDVAGEVCDYASTKPLYQKWSQKFADATDGKSFGNLRAMHANVAAGKLVDIAFNDEHKRIEICGKVVDDAEWQKVEEGVYTGFSQGGRYLKRWPDPDAPALMRSTAEPLEVSLVDHPCLPEATFAVIKADGSTELRKFKAAAAANSTSLADALAKIGARHAKADKERIKQTHDLLVALDPDCCAASHIPGANVEPRPRFSPQAGQGADEASVDDEADKLAKIIDRSVQGSLAKALRGFAGRIEEMAARLKKIEDQPLPLGTTSVRIVEKSEDSFVPSPEHFVDQPGALEALAEAAIRKAQSQPMRAIPGFRPRQG